MKQKRFSIQKRLQSIHFALHGLKILIRDEHNARIHLIAAIVVLISGILFRISVTDWIAIIFAIGLVLAIEIINTTIERIADFISPEKQEAIKKIKDLSAASVLIAAITALIIGLFVFIPKILKIC